VPCDEDDASAVRGYPVKGRIVQVQADRATLLIQHDEIPGVMRAMTMEFHADPDVLAAAKPGRELLARIERRGQPWWIFGVKWLGPS
jgi:Cu/Ag efflux protein CusF